MEIVALLYLLSSAGYFAYFFAQKEVHQKAGYYLLAAGFLCNLVVILYAWAAQGRFPASGLSENLTAVSCAVAGVFIGLRFRLGLRVLGTYAAALSALMMVAACAMKGDVSPEVLKNYNSILLSIHVLMIFIGEASLALACGTGILYLLQENEIKSKRKGFFFKRLPSLDLLDTTGQACILLGFVFLTIGLAAGIVYAKSVWGRFWAWDPKEVWSGITWLVYAALLHGRYASGWQGRRSAVMAVIGFGLMLFTFFGVNIFMQGHHGEFTKW